MIDLKNVLDVINFESINEIVVLPISVITFFLLMYIVGYLWKKDPDIIRSRIFLKYSEFKKAFLSLAVFAFVLMLHVSLIYIPHFLSLSYSLYNVQRVFGLLLVLIMITFVYFLLRSMSNNTKNL